MTQNEALKLRTILDALFSFEEDGRYGVAIQSRYLTAPTLDYEVHVFLRDDSLSGHLILALLAHAIELVSTKFLAVESHYDLSTIKGEKIVQSWKIW